MKFDTIRGHGSAYAVQEQALMHFRTVLHRLDVAFSEVSRLLDGAGVRVISPVDGREAAARRVQRIAVAYATVCDLGPWAPPRCRLELPIGPSDRVATARVDREWLPDGPPWEHSDDAAEALTSRIEATAEIETGRSEVSPCGL